MTAAVETVKLADDAPAGTVTLVGSEVMEELSETVTDSPPEGAGPATVIVQVLESAPATRAGKQESDEIACPAPRMRIELVTELPLYVTVMIAVTLLETCEVDIVNVAEEAPAAMVRLAGTVAAGLSEDKVTTAPPEGAAVGSVTVHVSEEPQPRCPRGTQGISCP